MVEFRRTLSALALFAALVVAGCQSAGVDDLAPQAFVAPKNTGEFPKIGYIPVGETAQLGAAGAAALRGQLTAARASQAAVADAPESYAEKLRLLRLLQAKHAADTLAEIEARKPQ
jgi:hypothetical protein